MDLSRVPRLPLLDPSSSIEPVDGLGRHLGTGRAGVRLSGTRDDLARFGLGGNERRKLERLVGTARTGGTDTAISVRATQSNHVGLTPRRPVRTCRSR